MAYEIGDRVRFRSADYPVTAKPEDTGLPKTVILEFGKEGTVAGFHESGHPSVKWDAGVYRIYRNMETTATGMRFLDSGSMQCPAFETGLHSDNIEPILPGVAQRKSTAQSKQREQQQKDFGKVNAMADFLALYFCGPFGFQDFTTDEKTKIAHVFVSHWNKADDAIATELEQAGFSLKGRMSPPAYYVRKVKDAGDAKYRELIGSTSQAEGSATYRQGSWWQFWK